MPSETEYFVALDKPDKFTSQAPHTLRHNYNSHPLFSREKVFELANYLMPMKRCRFSDRDLQPDSEFYHTNTPPGGLSLEQFLNGIEEEKSWMALYNIQAHPEYQELLDQIVGQLSPSFEPYQGKFFGVAGFMFLSSAPAFTPFHIDRENNFWLQLDGRKKLSLFERNDESILTKKQIEDFIIYRSLDEVKLNDEIKAKQKVYDVSAGSGVYFPSTTPHMTETEKSKTDEKNNLSISIGVVFYTEKTLKTARLCHYNQLARKLRLPLSDLTGEQRNDHLKAKIGQLYATARVKLRGYDAPQFSY